MKRFYKYHPERGSEPSLREQIVTLEEISGLTAFMYDKNLCIDVDTTTNPEYPRSERIPYILSYNACPRTGLIEWVLKQKDKRYTLTEEPVNRPDLLEIVVSSKQTQYRGVKVDGNVFWTNDEHDHAALKLAVEQLAHAQRKIVELLKEE